MKDNMKENTPDPHGGDQPESTGDGPLADYTPQQRRTIDKGLRILARVAIRSYLRQRAGDSQAATDPVEGNDG